MNCIECDNSYTNGLTGEIECSLPVKDCYKCPNLIDLGSNEQEYNAEVGYI